MMYQVGKCKISTCAWALASISWPIRNIKAAMQKLHISPQLVSAWTVSWLWVKSSHYSYACSLVAHSHMLSRWWQASIHVADQHHYYHIISWHDRHVLQSRILILHPGDNYFQVLLYPWYNGIWSYLRFAGRANDSISTIMVSKY